MRTAICALLMLSFGAAVSAGQLYGTIVQNGRPLRQAPVELRCGGETASDVTDDDGVYRLFVRATGRCQFVVEPKGRNAAAAIYSYDRPTAYNFDLISRNGRWELERR